MNIYQRVTLILGAIAAVVVFLMGAPWGPVVAFQVAFLGRLVLVLAVTGMVWLALRGIRFDAVNWARFRKRTRAVYLILWSGWLFFGLVWIPIQSEYERSDILSKQDQIMNRYPELRSLTHEMMRDFIELPASAKDDVLQSHQLKPELQEGLERIRRLPDAEHEVFWSVPLGFAGTYRKDWLSILIFLFLIPAGLYALPRVILVAARWADWGFKGE